MEEEEEEEKEEEEGGGGGRRFRIDELSYLVGVCRRYNYRSNNGWNATASYGRRDA